MMRSKFFENYRFKCLVICVFLLLPTASFNQEGRTEEQVPNSLLELLEGDGPLYDLIYDLEECYDRHLEVLKVEERAAQAEQEKMYEEFFKRMADLTGERSDAEVRRGEDALARMGREIQRLASEYDLQALFPDSAEERFLRCQNHLRMSQLRLKMARKLNDAYREVLVSRGAEKFFPEETPEDWDLWQMEIDDYECSKSEERPPLQTQIRLPAGARRPFVLKTFCLDRNKLGPDDGQALEIIGHASFLGRTNLKQQLKDAAAFPAREIDVQMAIWEESKEEEEGEYPPSKGPKPVPSGKTDSSGGITDLPDAVSNEEILAEVAKRLEEAMEKVRNGDHSQEALKELLEAMEAARNIGLEEPLEEAWDVFRNGLWEETVSSYNDYKADPSDANRADILEYLETVRQVDPPEGKQGEFDRMLEDIFGVPRP